MESLVALVQARPETVIDDVARLLRLAELLPVDGPEPGSLNLLMPSVDVGPTPAGCPTPWLLAGAARAAVAAGLSPGEMTVCCDADTVPPAWAAGIVGELELSLATRPGAGPRWLLGGLTLHRRLRTIGPVAAALAHLAPGLNPATLVRRPEPLRHMLRELAPRCPDAAVMDLTVCADGPDPLAMNLLLAGRDLVAVETVACQLLGLAPSSAPLVDLAARAGWGVLDPGRLTVVGDLAALTITPNRTATLPASGWTVDDLPAWARKPIRSWDRWSPASRGRRNRYDSMAWGRLWRDPEALVR